MDAAARRQAIIETAMPLFARKGFAGTTTKEIAERAGVSEALLYQHFPNKAALYEAIQRFGCQIDPALAEMNALAASTATLVDMVQAMFQHIVFGAFADPATARIRQRLVLQSLLDDGEYARILLSRVAASCLPIFTSSFAAAKEAGDVHGDMDPRNAFWFAGHIASQIANVRLPECEIIPQRGTLEEITAEAVRFCLRGMGLSQAAIERYCGPGAGGPVALGRIASLSDKHQIKGPAPGAKQQEAGIASQGHGDRMRRQDAVVAIARAAGRSK